MMIKYVIFYTTLLPHVTSLFIPSPNAWKHANAGIKHIARNWFIKHAEKNGIPWTTIVEKYKDKKVFGACEAWKHVIENKHICYPSYFLQPFHGYEHGNMNWDAAVENEAATTTISANYWKNVDPHISETWLRNNITQIIHTYIENENVHVPNTILDLGCSIGISTESLARKFPGSRMIGMDLSPYFLSVASYRSSNSPYRIEYIHANAENIPLETNSVDLIAIQFMLHEVPEIPTYKILNEVFRVLKPKGMITVVDLDPLNLKNLFNGKTFRKWAFEITEPHINDYYKNDMRKVLMKSGFCNIMKYQNDPLNAVWCAVKMPVEYVETYTWNGNTTSHEKYPPYQEPRYAVLSNT
jgi:ubiquinone/menaquinone biosynthesis C-methylase UbiE